MKKLMTIAAVAACGAAFAVESGIVGYKSDTLAGDNFNMIAIPFNQVSGGGINISTDLTFTGVAGSDWADSCDFIEIWDPANNGYALFYYNTDENVWKDSDDIGTFEDAYPDGLPAGTAMWYEAFADAERSEPLTITYAGAVELDSTVTYNLAGDNFNMIANPYPVAFDFNDSNAVTFTGVAGSDWADSCDFIEIWDPANNGYALFYYNTDENVWKDSDDIGTFADTYPDGLPAGTPFWYEAFGEAERVGSLSITFRSSL